MNFNRSRDRSEEYILSTFLINKDSIREYRHQIDYMAFNDIMNRFVCKNIFNRFDANLDVDLPILAEQVSKDIGKESEIEFCFNTILHFLECLTDNFFSNCERMREKVIDLNKKYCLDDALKVSEKIARLSEEDLLPDDLINKVRDIVFNMKANFIDNNKNVDEVGNVAINIFEKAERIKNNTEQIDTIDTGFKNFHDTLGELYKGDFIVLGAVSSMGKTTVALNLIKGIAENGNKVLIESIEMTKEKITEKFLSMSAEVNNKLIPNGMYSEDQTARIKKAVFDLKKLPITIKTASRLTAEKVAKDVYTYKPDVVMIDFLQKMKWTGREKRHAMEQICDDLYALAKETNTIILLLSQLVGKAIESRPLQDRRPQMYDLKEAGGITEDADIILMLYNEAYYLENPSYSAQRLLEIIVRKNRMGARNKTMYADFRREVSLIKKIQKKDDEDEM